MGARCGSHVVIVTVISRVQGAPSVSREGIEPSTRGLKVPCSATELPAHISFDSTSIFQQFARPPPTPEFRLDSNRDSNRRKMTKKKANGEGSVFCRGDGRVVGVYEDANGRTKYITSTTMTKAEMRVKVRKALEDRDKGIAYDSQNLTVERYMVDHWLPSVHDNVRPGTYRPYEAVARLHINPTLGTTKLDKLNAMQLEQLYRQKLKEGFSARRVK